MSTANGADGRDNDDVAADVCDPGPDTNCQGGDMTTPQTPTNGWHADPVKLAIYTNGLLIFGIVISLIFHAEVVYALYRAYTETLTADQMIEIAQKLAIWAGLHQVPIALHGAGTISLRGVHKRFNEEEKWRMRPWLIGTEIFAVSAVISVFLLLAGTHVTGTVLICLIIFLDLLAEALIWGGVRYVKDHKWAITTMAQMIGLLPQLAGIKPTRKK